MNLFLNVITIQIMYSLSFYKYILRMLDLFLEKPES